LKKVGRKPKKHRVKKKTKNTTGDHLRSRRLYSKGRKKGGKGGKGSLGGVGGVHQRPWFKQRGSSFQSPNEAAGRRRKIKRPHR